MPTTDIVLHTGRELAVDATFADNFPAIAPTPESAELMAEILGDETLELRNLPKIKIPSAELDEFIYTVGGTKVMSKTLEGIMVHYVPQRAFWTNPDPSGVAPECSSSDNKTPDFGGLYHPNGERGAENPTGRCADCPMAQKGTDLKGGKMAACKETRQVFFMLKNKLLPVVVQVPPSSIGVLKDFLVGMAQDGTGWWAVELTLGLEKASNAKNNAFNKLTVTTSAGKKLGDTEAIAAKEYRSFIKELTNTQPVPVFEAAPAGDAGGFSVGEAAPKTAAVA
jgi:hypothetical protein